MRLEKVGLLRRLLVFCLLLSGGAALAQIRDSLLDKRVEYIYHFSQEVTWPNFSSQKKFYVELVGRNLDFYSQLTSFFEDKTVQGKEISVSNTQDWRTRNRSTRPNIVYVDETSLHYLPEIVRFFEGYPVLIVSSRPYMEKGWMVSFTERFLEKPYLKGDVSDWGYSLNCETIEVRAKLSISSRLRDGALLVIPVQKKAAVATVGHEGELENMASKIDALQFEILEKDSIVKQQRREISSLHDTIVRQRRKLEFIDSSTTVRFVTAAEFLRGFLAYDTSYFSDQLDIGERIRFHQGSLVAYGAEPHDTTYPWDDNRVGYFLLILALSVGATSVALSNVICRRIAGSGSLSETVAREQQSGDSENIAERQRRIQNAFFANVSHELRTPLNAIVGLSQLLASEDVEGTELKSSLEIINQSAHGLLRMMDSVITKAMLDAGEMRLEETLANPLSMLTTLSKESEELLQNMGKREVVAFRQEFAPDLPKSAWLDYEKVQSILGVLLSNAVRFTSLGEVVLGCDVRHGEELSFIRFYVGDTGRGMNAAQLKTIGEHFSEAQRMPFTGLDTAISDGDSGMGLGLSIACGLTEILGTHLAIDSQPGLGTNVSFELPLRAV